LGVGTEEFRSLTWRQFVALIDQFKAARRRAEFYPAQIAAILVNVNQGEKGKSVTTEDMMLDGKPAQKQTPGQMRMMVESLNEAFGGTVRPKTQEE